MRIVVNGDQTEVGSEELIAILQSLEFECDKVVVAVNQQFVAREQWPNYCVRSGDELDILSPIEGG